MEYCHNGAWGSVCHDSWQNVDAGVVCEQLGYEKMGEYMHMYMCIMFMQCMCVHIIIIVSMLIVHTNNVRELHCVN